MADKARSPRPSNTQAKEKGTAAPTKRLPYEPRKPARPEIIDKQMGRPKAAAAAAAATPKQTGASALANALRTPSKLRPIILTAAVCGITATGVWYGASMKLEGEVNEEKRKLLKTEPDERIQHLLEARKKLEGVRDDLAGKIEELQARQKLDETKEPAK